MKKEKKKLTKILYDYKNEITILSILLIIVILIAILLSVIKDKNPSEDENNITTSLFLFGNQVINLTVGEEYVEPGYYAIDSNGVLKTKDIIVTNNINTSKAGTYRITYQISDKVEERTIIVKAKEENETTESKLPLSLTLEGENVINLSVGETYNEPGYKALDGKGQDATSKVIVNGNVDTSKAGNYTLTYTLEDEGEIKEVIRTIIVLEDNLTITINPNTTNYTNSVTLNIKVDGNNFNYLILPNQKRVDSKTTTYNITTNGTYTVTALNKNNRVFSKNITINNIDKNPPSGTCNATVNNNNTTTFMVTASDNESGINNYVYYDNGTQIMNTTTGNYTYNQKVSTNVYVKVYDKAKNEKFIYCNVVDNSKPDRSGSPIILIGDSRTVDMCGMCNLCSGNKVIAKSGMSYSWLVDTAIPETNSYLNKNPNQSYNIFILLGINGIGSSTSSGTSVSNKYYNKVNELAQGSWKNHYIYYVSVNPASSSSTTKAIQGFNSNMKSKIQNANIQNLKYCDTYSTITLNSSTIYNDGIHYRCPGYRPIYNGLKACLK